MNTISKCAVFASIQLSAVSAILSGYAIYKIGCVRYDVDRFIDYNAKRQKFLQDELSLYRHEHEHKAYIKSHQYYAGKIDGLQDRIDDLVKNRLGQANSDCELRIRRLQMLTNAIHSVSTPSN